MMFVIGQATLMAHHMPREEDHRMVEPPTVDQVLADIENNKTPLPTIPEEPTELTIVDSDDVDKTEPKSATPPPLTIGSVFKIGFEIGAKFGKNGRCAKYAKY